MAKPSPANDLEKLRKVCASESDPAIIDFIQDSPIPMWIFDQETLRFLEVNQAAMDQYGYSRREFLSLTVLDIRPHEDVPEFLNAAVRSHHSSIAPELWKHRLKNNQLILVEIQSLETIFRERKVEVVAATFRQTAQE